MKAHNNAMTKLKRYCGDKAYVSGIQQSIFYRLCFSDQMDALGIANFYAHVIYDMIYDMM
jgi:hypothetical protein